MKLPPVKKLTKKQALRYKAAIEAAFPEARDLVATSKPLTKAERALQDARSEGYTMGVNDGVARGQREASKYKEELESRRHRVAALQELTKFLSVAGQTAGEFARAMQSEANQL